MPLQLSASLNLTGSLNLSGSMTATQILNITASVAQNSITASYISASNIIGTVISSSYSLSSSYSPTNITSSWSTNSLTASSINFTASNATLAQTASSLISSSTYTVNALNAITSLSSSRVVVAGTASNDTDAITRGYIISRGQNLATNGFGNLFNNYNFPTLGFDPVDTFAGGGSFTSSAYQGQNICTELIPVNTQLPYRGTLYVKSGDQAGTRYTASNIFFAGIDCYDIDQLQIFPVAVYKYPGSTDTTLYSALNVGDTTITVTDTTGWYNSTLTSYRRMTWWPYTSSKGYSYDNYTYSRNYVTNTSVVFATSASYYNTNGFWASGSITQSVGSSSITLTSPWPGPALPVGTPVRNSIDAGTYKYVFASSQFIPSGSWTKITNVVSGLDANGIDSGSSIRVFRPATAFVKLMFLTNYSSGGSYAANSNVHRISAVTFGSEADTSGSAYVVGGNVVTANAILGTSNNYSLQLETNNVVRMTVSSSGNIGIGITNPVNKLDVLGNISASVVTASLFSGSLTGSVFGTSSWSNNSLTASSLITTNSYIITNLTASNISASGTGSFDRIGIGITNPVNKLDVSGNISCSVITASLFSGSLSGSVFGTSSWSSNSLTASSLVPTNNYTASTLNVNSSGSTSASTNGSLTITGQNTKGGSNYHDFLYARNTVAGAVNANKFFRQDNTGNFEIVNSGYNNTIFILTDSGSLQLPLAQSSNVTQLRNTGAGIQIGGLTMFDDGNVHIHDTTPNTNLWVNVSGSGNVIVNAQTGASGGMCIGSTNSRGKLDVNGSVNYDQGTFTFYAAGTYGGSASGTINISVYASDRMAATEFDARSDKRLKKDIRPIDTQMALQFVKTSKPVLYKWNIGSDDGDKSGYVAQDIIKIGFPHLISGIPNDSISEETDSDGYTSPDKVQFSMNYNQVVPLLDAALKNALQRIESMEMEIQLLKAQLNK